MINDSSWNISWNTSLSEIWFLKYFLECLMTCDIFWHDSFLEYGSFWNNTVYGIRLFLEYDVLWNISPGLWPFIEYNLSWNTTPCKCRYIFQWNTMPLSTRLKIQVSNYVMVTNKMHFLNSFFNSILFVCYMFRTPYVHLREEHVVHAALYGTFSMHLCKSSVRLKGVLTTHETACINAWKTYHIRLHVQYSLPEDEHKMFETCRRQEKLIWCFSDRAS
jgi:hypothetical protein